MREDKEQLRPFTVVIMCCAYTLFALAVSEYLKFGVALTLVVASAPYILTLVLIALTGIFAIVLGLIAGVKDGIYKSNKDE